LPEREENTEVAGMNVLNGNGRLLEIKDLIKYYRRGRKLITALDSVSLHVDRGEAVGLVGESGCGKSTLARLVLGLGPPDRGSILFDAADMLSLRGEALRRKRKGIQIVFQDCGSVLNPRLTVGAAITEPIANFNPPDSVCLDKKLKYLFEMVGLEKSLADRFPHQLSGGQRQRVGIARALAPEPFMLVCDEPVSSLDVSVQSQIIDLFLELKKGLKLSYLFISHDLAVVNQICDRVAVMYLGRLAEVMPVTELVSGAMHPYTQALVSAIPANNPEKRGFPCLQLRGEVLPVVERRGCLFAPRCVEAQSCCYETVPCLVEISPGHSVACHNIKEKTKTS